MDRSPSHPDQLDCSSRTGSGQLHSLEKESFVDGTAQGLNVVPYRGGNGNGNGQCGNGAIDAKEGNTRPAVFNAILVGYVACIWLKRTGHDLYLFLIAIRV